MTTLSPLAKSIHEYLRRIEDNRESFLQAWFAENLVSPKDAMLMQQDMG